MLQRGLPSLDGKVERFVTKKWKKRLPNSSQTGYSVSKLEYLFCHQNNYTRLSEDEIVLEGFAHTITSRRPGEDTFLIAVLCEDY